MVRYFTHIPAVRTISFSTSQAYTVLDPWIQNAPERHHHVLDSHTNCLIFLVALHSLVLLRRGSVRGRDRRGFGGGLGGDCDVTIELVGHLDGRANGNGGIAKGAVRAMRHKAKGIGTAADQITERRFEFKLHLGQFLGRGRRCNELERRIFWGAHLVVLAHDDRRVGAGRRHGRRQGRERVEGLTRPRKGLIVGRLDTVLQEDGIVVAQVQDERIGQNDRGLTLLLAVNAERF
jgi:hypothetical protein